MHSGRSTRHGAITDREGVSFPRLPGSAAGSRDAGNVLSKSRVMLMEKSFPAPFLLKDCEVPASSTVIMRILVF